MPVKGKIVSIGSEVKSVKVGDVVLYKKWEAYEIEWEGKKYLLFDDGKDNILATFDE